jgi:hypothetical protein
LLAGLSTLKLAKNDEVVLERVPEVPAGCLLVGEHPLLPFEVLSLATEDEVHLEEVQPSSVWPVGVPRMTTAPGDAPMIFATKPR